MLLVRVFHSVVWFAYDKDLQNENVLSMDAENGVSDDDLRQAVMEMNEGLIDADLCVWVCQERTFRPVGQGVASTKGVGSRFVAVFRPGAPESSHKQSVERDYLWQPLKETTGC